MLALSQTVALWGLSVIPVSVEADIGDGLPRTQIVGLPGSGVRESIDRLLSAFAASEVDYPAGRVTVNLAPTDLRKTGAHYDLPIAISLLQAMGVVSLNTESMILLMGELGLDGRLRPVTGVLNAARWAKINGIQTMLVPELNAPEAMAGGVEVWPAASLMEAVNLLSGRDTPRPVSQAMIKETENTIELDELHGQTAAKRALEISAAGGHSLLMVGPPGAGKTLLARAMSGVLPELTASQALDATCIHEAAGQLSPGHGLLARPPFRAPHHSASAAAMVGGGSHPKPGEVSLAHHGVLFLDELPEFRRDVLEALRQPLEERSAVVSRAAYSTRFPADFQLVAAMNPCPCGAANTDANPCTCAPGRRQQYQRRLSGPLLDRIDLRMPVSRIPVRELTAGCKSSPSTSDVARCVARARNLQRERQGVLNSRLNIHLTESHCRLQNRARRLLEQAVETFSISARGYHKLLRVSRTIADLEGEEHITADHMAEALPFRPGGKRP